MARKNWFAAFAPVIVGAHQSAGQPGATRAPTAANPQNPLDFVVAQNEMAEGAQGQPRAPTDAKSALVALGAQGAPSGATE